MRETLRSPSERVPLFNGALTASSLLVPLAHGSGRTPRASSAQREVAGVPPRRPGGPVDRQEVFVSRGTAQPGLPEVLRACEEKLAISGPHAALQERAETPTPGGLGRRRLEHLTVLPVDPGRTHLHQRGLTLGVVGDGGDGASDH